MKLSKQERIGVLIIAVILILGLGIWLFIVPKFESVSQSNITLDSKTQELKTAQEKAATKDQLKEQVLAAYEAGENLADMFFEEMTHYQADEEFRAFLDQCKTNIYVADMSVGEPTVSTLAPTYFEKQEVEYALKTYVTQGVEPTEAELATAKRWETVRNILGTSQDVGSISVDFEVVALTPEEIIAFCDEVNDYVKKENNKDTRKAVMISGLSVTYIENENLYDELIEEIELEAADKALDALYKEMNMKRPVDETANQPATEEEEEATLSVTDYIYSLSATITFYSVERMQDPADQLEAQEQ